jgi:hypothetical protein
VVRNLRKFLGYLEFYLLTKGVWRFGGQAAEGALLGKWCWTMLVDREDCGLECWLPGTRWREGDTELEGGGGLHGGGR